MVNPNGRKGARFETDVMKWLRSMGAIAERLTKTGTRDEGDLVATVAGKTYIFELKNRKKLDLSQFWAEALVEANNYTKARGLSDSPPAFVIVKRRNHRVDEAWVIQDLGQWLNERQ